MTHTVAREGFGVQGLAGIHIIRAITLLTICLCNFQPFMPVLPWPPRAKKHCHFIHVLERRKGFNQSLSTFVALKSSKSYSYNHPLRRLICTLRDKYSRFQIAADPTYYSKVSGWQVGQDTTFSQIGCLNIPDIMFPSKIFFFLCLKKTLTTIVYRRKRGPLVHKQLYIITLEGHLSRE